MITAIVLALLLLLPALKACRWLSAGWLTALSPLWAAYLVVVWTIMLSWLEVTTNLGLIIWAPCVAGMLAFVVAWIDAPDLEEDLEVPPAYGAGGLGDRVLELDDRP